MAGGEKLGGGYIALSAEKQQLVRDLQSAKQSVGSWFQSLQSYLAPIGIGLSAAAIWGTLQGAATAAEEAERSFKRLEATVDATGASAGFTAEQLAKMAGDLQMQIGYTDEAIQETMVSMMRFGNVTGDVFKQAIELSADLSSSEGDMAAKAMALGRALEDPLHGVQALRRAGIMFDEAEKAKIKTLVKSNNLLAAQAMILDKVRSRVGGRAGKSATPMMLARVRKGEAEEALGKEVQPLMVALVNLQTMWTQALTKTLKVVNAIAPAINAWINPMEGFSGKVLVATGLVYGLAKAIPLVGMAAKAAARAIQLATVSTGWGIAIVAIGAVVAGLWSLVEVGMKTATFAGSWPAIAHKFRAAWEGAIQVVNALWMAFAGVVNGILAALGFQGMAISESIGGALVQVLDLLADAALGAAAWALALVQHSDLAWTAFTSYAAYAFLRAGDVATGFFMLFVRTAQNAISAVLQMFGEIPTVIADIFNGASVTDAISGALARVSQDFRKQFEKDFSKSLLKESPATAAMRGEGERAVTKLMAEAAKNAADFVRKTTPKDAAAATKAATKDGKPTSGKMPKDAAGPVFKSGLYGLEDYSKMIQEAFLKAEDPTEKLVGLTEKNNAVQEEQLKTLKEIEDKTPVELATADE